MAKRISELTNVTSLATNDIFPVVDVSESVTSKITVSNLYESLLEAMPPMMHRNIFRGKNLGSSVTATQLSQIRNATFNDLFIGDYWTINGKTWRIVDMNYFKGVWEPNTTEVPNHLVIMPDTLLIQKKMNTTDTNAGGYLNSDMRKNQWSEVISIINAAFPGMTVPHTEFLTNSNTTEGKSATSIADSIAELPTEIAMYGSTIHPVDNLDRATIHNTSTRTQFSLFRLYPQYINYQRNVIWLRDLFGTDSFGMISSGSSANFARATLGEYGARPYFLIG